MKPVYQTIFDKTQGNCVSAVLASLLEIPLEDVPHFSAITDGDFFPYVQQFMLSKGYEYDQYLINGNRTDIEKPDEFVKFRDRLPDFGHINGMYDTTVYSWKHGIGICHNVICDKDFNIVHDPNPSNKGVTKYPQHEELGYNGILGVTLWVKKSN